uniref:Translposase n=1 Tax=Nostoc sp. PCC 9448 TaxID=2099384 RepID=A0A2P0ZGN2_9NOSO|nr:translposase [Nostoc sp. PCC 9448]
MSHYQGKTQTENLDNVGGKYLTSFQRKLLQKSLQDNLPESYRQRIEIILFADEGKTQTEICQTLGCSPATARHWIHIARTGMAHQWQDCPIGRPKTINEQYLERLKELATHSPRDYGYSFQRWTGSWLSQHLAKEFGIEVSGHHINRILKQMGLSRRAKSDRSSTNTNQQDNGAKILISDLQSQPIPDHSGFLLIDLAN